MASLKQPGVRGGGPPSGPETVQTLARHGPAFEGAQRQCFLLNMATLSAWPSCSGWEGPVPRSHLLRKSQS